MLFLIYSNISKFIGNSCACSSMSKNILSLNFPGINSMTERVQDYIFSQYSYKGTSPRSPSTPRRGMPHLQYTTSSNISISINIKTWYLKETTLQLREKTKMAQFECPRCEKTYELRQGQRGHDCQNHWDCEKCATRYSTVKGRRMHCCCPKYNDYNLWGTRYSAPEGSRDHPCGPWYSTSTNKLP